MTSRNRNKPGRKSNKKRRRPDDTYVTDQANQIRKEFNIGPVKNDESATGKPSDSPDNTTSEKENANHWLKKGWQYGKWVLIPAGVLLLIWASRYAFDAIGGSVRAWKGMVKDIKA